MQENTALFEFDAQIAAQGYPLVCGVDEAGRGPLAGPVVAAAVILPPQEQLLERWPQLAQLNDSKKLSEKKREQLFEPICQAAVAYGIGQADCGEIDQLNILNATFLAMSRAVQKLEENFSLHPDILLVDGNRDPKITQPKPKRSSKGRQFCGDCSGIGACQGDQGPSAVAVGCALPAVWLCQTQGLPDQAAL